MIVIISSLFINNVSQEINYILWHAWVREKYRPTLSYGKVAWEGQGVACVNESFYY